MQPSKTTRGLIWTFHALAVVLSVPFSLALIMLGILFLLHVLEYPWNSAMYPSFTAMLSEVGPNTVALGAFMSFSWTAHYWLRKQHRKKDIWITVSGILVLLLTFM